MVRMSVAVLLHAFDTFVVLDFKFQLRQLALFFFARNFRGHFRVRDTQ